jgi:hypothetical protein
VAIDYQSRTVVPGPRRWYARTGGRGESGMRGGAPPTFRIACAEDRNTPRRLHCFSSRFRTLSSLGAFDMPAKKKQGGNRVYQLKITLKGIRPPIWRRIQVAGDMNLHQLHRTIQSVMGWYGGHLHEFIFFGTSFGDRSVLTDMDILEERKFTLNKLISAEKEKFHYLYDFGDGWDHEVLVEKLLPIDERTKYPVCLKGKRACPPEDCGGPYGYQELLEVLKDPSHPEYGEMRGWLPDEDFDPERFEVEEADAHLRGVSIDVT